jgi:hemolysin type calcium-binding protein
MRTSRVVMARAAGVAALGFGLVVSAAGATSATAAPPSCAGLISTVPGLNGTAGDDIIVGTPGDDVINGRGGNDVLCGAGGNDKLFGGKGADRLEGQAGADELYGGGGHDVLVSDSDDVVVDGQGGNDCTPTGAGTSIELTCPTSGTTSTSSSTTTTTAPPVATVTCTTPPTDPELPAGDTADDSNTQYDFGRVFNPSSTSASVTVTVTCTASGGAGAQASLGTATLLGGDTAFSLVSPDSCSNSVVTAPNACTLDVRFTTTTVVTGADDGHKATLQIDNLSAATSVFVTFEATDGGGIPD